MEADPVEPAADAAQAARDQQERHAEAQRVREQQHRPGGDARVQQDREDERQVRADARRPARAEGDADEQRAPVAARAAFRSESDRALQQRDGDEPDHVHPEHDEHEPGDALQPHDQIAAEGAEQGDADPEEREDRAEAGDEDRGVRDGAAAVGAIRRALTREVDQVRRDQREHARGQE